MFAASCFPRYQFEKSGLSILAVDRKSDGQFVGRVGLWPLPERNEIELDYAIAKPFWRLGYATEASAECVDRGFREQRIGKIVGLVVPGNHGSVRVLRKLGFEFIRADHMYDMDVLYHRLDKQRWFARTFTLDSPSIERRRS